MNGKVAMVIVRSWMDFDTAKYDPGVDCSVEPSLTKQEFRDECDINVLMARYEKTGIPPDHFASGTPRYGDFTDVPDYHSAMNTVIQAQTLFEALPARVRERFGNDPAQMLDFLRDPENKAEAIELGLVDRPADPEPPTRVEVVQPAEPPAPPPQPPAAS